MPRYKQPAMLQTTHIEELEMETNNVAGKFGLIERDLRILITLGLIIAVLLQALPPWVAFATVYLFTTALFSRDPVYAFLQFLQSTLSHKGIGLERA